MSHPDGLPDLFLFLDRSLGRIKVPRLLRAPGCGSPPWQSTTAFPPMRASPTTSVSGSLAPRGWVVLMKETRGVRYNRAEREAIKAYGVRCFCPANQTLAASPSFDRRGPAADVT